MSPEWFRRRGYKHFDAPVTEAFARKKASSTDFVRRHSWLPLIAYVKRIKRYRPAARKTAFKDRPIMYPSHRDSCILSRYTYELNTRLANYYQESDLGAHVIAYRKLGKANYHFAADAFRYCLENEPCVVLCFDITGFFDNLDHSILKDRLKRVLKVGKLTEDWYKVFRFATQYRAVDRCELAEHPDFGERLRLRGSDPIATISEIKRAGI